MQDGKAAESEDDTKAGTKRVDTPILVLVPFAYGTDERLANQRTATFKPGQRVRQLEEQMGFFENIRALRIACR